MVNVINRWHILVFIFLALMVVGCRPEQEEGTPTPFGTWSPVGDSRPVTVELAEVAESPDSYEGAYIQLSGQYERLPLLVCGSDAHPSPATWQLTTAEGTIVVSGRESELRRLVPDGLWMTVTGRMTYFEGAVGCGKRARTQQMWVLNVDKVVSPNPIARVTLTPGGVPVSGVDVPTPDGGGLAFPTTAVSPTPQLAFPTATPLLILTSTPLPLTPAVTATRVPDDEEDESSPTATPTQVSDDEDDDGGKEEATVTATATSRGTAIAITPTASATPNGSSTATPTATAGDATTIDQGNLISEEILYGKLGDDEQHSWSLNVAVTDTLSAYAVGDSQTDMVITVLNALTGDVLVTKDDHGAGEAESLMFAVTSGQYNVILSAVGENGRYSALYTLDDASINMTMLGLLAYGQTESGTLQEDNDHYWVFEGELGDEININVTPTGEVDLMIELLDHTDFVDDNGSGGAEELSFTLPSDGLYIVYVAEVDFETAVYAITITKN